MNYKLTKTTLDQIYAFSQLYERLYLISKTSLWLVDARKLATRKSALASVMMNKTRFDQIDYRRVDFDSSMVLNENEFNDFQNYVLALRRVPEIFSREKGFSLEQVELIHNIIKGEEYDAPRYQFRQEGRTLSRTITVNDVQKQIEYTVKTQPRKIMEDMIELTNWLNDNDGIENPLLMAAIAHVKLAQVHPYSDGNGRLARILDNGILYRHEFEFYSLISLEEYFLQNIEQYYQLIQLTIDTQDYTRWVEFYTAALLQSLKVKVQLLKKISGKSIDLDRREIIELTNREEEVLSYIVAAGQAGGAEIAREFQVSRQTVAVVLNKLVAKGLLAKLGVGAGTRFTIA